MVERFLPIPGFSRYLISESGVITRRGRALKPRTDKDGYFRIELYADDGIRRGHGVHFFVCLTFNGPQPSPDHMCCHNDGGVVTNHFSNLRWDTHAGNAADMIRHGTRRVGSRNGRAKITADQAKAIRGAIRLPPGKIRLPKGMAIKIAREIGIHRETVLRVARGRSWQTEEGNCNG